MSKSWQRLILAIVIAGGIGMTPLIDGNFPSASSTDPSEGLPPFAGLPHEPVALGDPPGDVRKAEQSRRAVRPPGDPKRANGWNYEEVLTGKGMRRDPRIAESLPPTYCDSIERVPRPEDEILGPHEAHRTTVRLFETRSGFGIWRMMSATNDRGLDVGSRDIDRVELVSLLTDEEPSVYMLDEMATPALARRAKRRPLDEFERLGLNAVRLGEELVWTRGAPTRMFGAIRARADCLHCHADAREGDLLGAFTYYLKVPVDRVHSVWEW